MEHTDMYKELLDKADATHKELLAAYKTLDEERARFQALLGAEATGSEVVGLLRKYGPLVAKYTTAAGGGAGVLTVLGNVFPALSKALGLGG